METTALLQTPILITLPELVPGEAPLIVALQRAGAGIIHLRKPNASTPQLIALLDELREAGADFQRITLHGPETLARRYGCGGIHLKNDVLNQRAEALARHPEALSSAEKAPLRISGSAHSWEEARRWAPVVDYLWLSPLFDSISKVGYRSGIDLADARRRLLNARRQKASGEDPSTDSTRFPYPERIVALGGISAENIVRVRMAGFGGAAVLGDLWAKTSTPTDSPEKTTPGTLSSSLDSSETIARFGRLNRRWKAAGGTLQLISAGDLTTASAFLAGGGRWIQLRMKEASADEIVSRSRALAALCRPYGAVLVLDDHPELVVEAEAQGVHLGKNDLPPAEARRLLGEGAIIGSTANTLTDIEAMNPDWTDYIGLGPFRYTTTKKNLAPLLGTEGYRRILTTLRSRSLYWPIVAIGGIEPADTPEILSTGVNGLAISGAIARSTDPAATTRQFLEGIDRWRIDGGDASETERPDP